MTDREIGPYRVKEQIPFRGPGRRFAATHAVLGRKATIRELPCASFGTADIKSAFLRAAKIVQRHAPQGVAVVQLCVEDADWISLVTEPWGETLEEQLQSGASFEPRAAVALCVSVLEGLRFLHQNGIVHGNVGAHSVVVAGDGAAKLVEWGVPRGYGSASYLSPECAAGNDPAERDDLYAAAVLLGRLAGDGVGAALREVLERALAPDPAGRFPDVREFLAALEALPPGDEEPAREGDAPPLLRFPGRRVPWTLLFGLMLALFVFVSMTRKSPPLPQVPHLEGRKAPASLPGLPPIPAKQGETGQRQKRPPAAARPEPTGSPGARSVDAQE